MEFLLTRYLFPLAEPLTLSKSLGFSFDNPKSEPEIERVTRYLHRAYESGHDYRFPIYSDDDIVTIEDTLFRLRDSLREHYPHVETAFDEYDREHVFEFVAQNWVIARFDDGGIGEELREAHREMREDGQPGFFLLDDDHVLVQKPKHLANYCSLLALLVNTEIGSYFGRPILLDPDPPDSMRPTAHIWREFITTTIASNSYPDSDDEARWWFFPYVLPELRRVADQIEEAFLRGQIDKFLYIGEVLKIASHETRDIKTRLVLLTSLIELVVTHSPDYHRFNVEDSIGKQFRLKASILVYLNDKTKDFDTIKSRLKTIYNQRSNVAHGNFSSVEKYVKNLPQKEGYEEYFDDLVIDLYSYLRSILEQYLKDPDLVEFIKDN